MLLSQFTTGLYEGLLLGQRHALARAITLVESSNKEKASEARKLMTLINKYNHDRNSIKLTSFRIGLSGPPGAGKSTFIESLGIKLTKSGHKVAVLAVDPSSGTTGGSLLGDKTRMPELTRDRNAYIRPSPNRCHLGGVTRTTNEAIALCEACGFDIIIVETVGVGQSEYLVSDMVDAFCLLIPPAGGDELQGLKRGIVEQSDLVIVNKCDGDLIHAAQRIKSEYTSALKYMRPKSIHWKPKVKMMSSKTGEGLDQVWETLVKYRTKLEAENEIQSKRARQHKTWMWNYIKDRLIDAFNDHPSVKSEKDELEMKVMNYEIPPGIAADMLLDRFFDNKKL